MRKLLVVLMFMGVAGIASADLAMTLVLEDHESGEKENMALYLSKDRMRSENTMDGMKFISIGRMDRDVIWMLRPDKKAYAELSMQDMRRMHEDAKAHEAAGRAILEGHMQGMSEEEQQQYRSYLGMDDDDIPLTYVKKGQDRAGKWTCTLYEGMRKGEKVEEICTVPLKSLGLAENDFDVLHKMAMEEDQKLGSRDWKEMEARGFPVRTVIFEEGERVTTELFVSIEKKPLASGLFEVPGDFTPVSMMGLYGE
ncbi:DUF4412 domain-containing protein [Desulfobotulus sp. H1]|uniref:DUF4412 domain-containing protein n=1 Tax=Desulfobotulus pelophilus TaxID=2823377 RepID=A0ABT3N638_9BACT|nr:DUF4412 domain-containing protein [Desulfobotulus pelophilus]MCW7752932.1 DUF4412 domain-containing protein [Desulfobotulus pelophilus]